MSFANAPARDRLGFLMVTLTRQWRRFVEEQLAANGLTDATWTPLLHLRAWGDGVTQKELAERVGLDGSTLVRLLDILEGKGWLERRADVADRRSKRIFLTADGNAAVDNIRATMLEAERSLLQDLNDSEIETMLGSVQKIQSRIETMHAQRCAQLHPEAGEGA
ncbi:MarR family transcriptional regulator [Comamonas sp. Y33R10-2]|uniref:MarR family winged helix-turn-helix transcriptional regulator n=1 Tax=Comamonas sp. Y33R10-2 TaxID=2853257 RepID=UPI001C5CB11B|nr:MarR family transcriptional regulator [Comamonas sp. Y33R10-2]QXZ09807.1 MarR family transcriptional regulator [Comamonas sp. Y33R10-2]